MKTFKIDNRAVGDNSPVFIIAEISANHGSDLEVAKETVRAAKRTGADAVKIQTYTADTITLKAPQDDFRVKQGTLWDGRYLHELYEEAHLPWEWHEALFEVAREEDLICFSSPFDPTAVELLESLEAPAYKIASFEITDIPLIELVASKGKPIILSTGIARLEDIELALETCRKAGNDQVALLKCTSSYPAPIDEANMAMIRDFKERFDVIVGLSDHTMGSTVPVVSTVLGAKIIEKHFILDRNIGGPDASFSMDEAEFTQMVSAVREAEKAVGKVDYTLTEKQKKSRDFSRSLYVVADIAEGEQITHENVRSIRPGFGLHPKYLKEVIGKRATRALIKGTALKWEQVSKD